MEELFKEISLYGRLTMYQNDNGKYAGWVSFDTIGNIKLDAHGTVSDDVKPLLISIISQAKEIIKSMGKEAERLEQITHG